MVKTENLEKMLLKIPGINGAKIVADYQGTLREIHILADIKKSPKQIVRDIETALYASSGIKIDRKIVSIVQMKQEGDTVQSYIADEEDSDFSKIDEESKKIQFEGLNISTSRESISFEVSISDNDSDFIGTSAIDANDQNEKYLSVVEATVLALREIQKSFRVEYMDIVQYGLTKILICVCSVNVNGHRIRSVGADFFDDSKLENVVRCVIDSMNKIYSKIEMNGSI